MEWTNAHNTNNKDQILDSQEKLEEELSSNTPGRTLQ